MAAAVSGKREDYDTGRGSAGRKIGFTKGDEEKKDQGRDRKRSRYE